MRAFPSIAIVVLTATLGLAACRPAPDPQAARAAQAAQAEQAADAMAQQFDAEFAQQHWDLARAHGDVLLAQYPDSKAAARIKPQHAEAAVKADGERDARRTAALWAYQSEGVEGGNQLSAAIYSKPPLDPGAGDAQPVRLIFRDHPQWGRSSYMVLAAGDFDCYGGCKVQVKADDAATRSMAASRPKTDEAIAMFIEDERALWRLSNDAKLITIEFPLKAGGTRSAVFEVGGLDASKLPKWN